MSSAEALHAADPAAGATEALVGFVSRLRHDQLSDEVRHYTKRHLMDTVGVMIAGAGGEVATRAGAMLASVRPAGSVTGVGAGGRAGVFALGKGGAELKALEGGPGAGGGPEGGGVGEKGIEGPPHVIEARDGFMQAFAFGRAGRARSIELPPAVPFGITDCYIKPYPCCRHIQPAVEALIGLLEDEKIATEDIKRIDTATYRIAAEHAETGWDDFASAQLSFPYLMALALKFRSIKLEHFNEQQRRDPALAALAAN